jgi:hypothetical protein
MVTFLIFIRGSWLINFTHSWWFIGVWVDDIFEFDIRFKILFVFYFFIQHIRVLEIDMIGFPFNFVSWFPKIFKRQWLGFCLILFFVEFEIEIGEIGFVPSFFKQNSCFYIFILNFPKGYLVIILNITLINYAFRKIL